MSASTQHPRTPRRQTVQGLGAFHVKNASAGTGQFTIRINEVPTAPATVTVAYFVISAS